MKEQFKKRSKGSTVKALHQKLHLMYQSFEE
jgi:hypothetical protein